MKKRYSFFFAFSCILVLLLALGISVSALPNAAAYIEIPKLANGKTITVDGEINANEGWGVPLLIIDESNMQKHSTKPAFTDFDTESIKAYYRWDETYFYFACEIVDPQHHNPHAAGSNWMGDSIRFDLSHDVAGDQNALDQTMKYWFSLQNNGSCLFYQEKAEDGCPKAGGDASAVYLVARNEATKTTTYELALRWDKNLPENTVASDGFTFITHQRVMERSAAEEEPAISISFPGYGAEAKAAGWWYAKLVSADQNGGVDAGGHTTTKVTASPASHESAGNIEHYTCSHCNFLFRDEAATWVILPTDAEIAQIAHRYNLVWKSDGAQHWKECACGSKKDVAPCTFDGYTHDDDGHFQKCTVCKNATETTEHTFGAAQSCGESGHNYTCVCGYVSAPTIHLFGEWVTVTAPTSDTVGVKERICSVCAYKENGELPVVEAGGCASVTATCSVLPFTLLAAAFFLLRKRKVTQ